MLYPILFKGSILYNIKYNNYKATNEDIIKAGELSNSMVLITNSIGTNQSLDLPQKSDSLVNNNDASSIEKPTEFGSQIGQNDKKMD